MNEASGMQGVKLVSGIAVGLAASLVAGLAGYVRREVHRRGFPAWQECQCEYKHEKMIFQVWYSRTEQRGETIVSHEWGSYLIDPPYEIRRLLHNASQILAVLNPRGRYVERVTLSPQEAEHFATLLRSASLSAQENEENGNSEHVSTKTDHVVWRREVLHIPRALFDLRMRRLYPVHLSQERFDQARDLPALWDPQSNLPLTSDGTLLELPVGTRIDYIGWFSSQISYCTSRTI